MNEEEADVLVQIFGKHAVILFETEKEGTMRDYVREYARDRKEPLCAGDVALLGDFVSWLSFGRLLANRDDGDPARVSLTETVEILRDMPDLELDPQLTVAAPGFTFQHGKHRFTFRMGADAWEMAIHKAADFYCVGSRPIAVLVTELDPWVLALGALKAAREFEIAKRMEGQ